MAVMGGRLTDAEVVDLDTWSHDPRMRKALREWLTVGHAITRNEMLYAITRKVAVSLRVADTLIRLAEDELLWDLDHQDPGFTFP